MKQKVALALGSGGARGLAHIGVIKELERQGFTILQLTSSMMLTRISNLLMELNKPDILIDIPADTAGTFDFYKATELIETGRNIAREVLDSFNRKNVN